MLLRKNMANLRNERRILLQLLFGLVFCTATVISEPNALDFDPQVTATCTDYQWMKVNVVFNQPFFGVVHTKDHRTDACEVFGDGDKNITLSLDVMAEANSIRDCGVKRSEDTGERYVSVFVRYHRTLERLEDKVFSISCSNPGYLNARNEISRFALTFVEDGRHTQEVVKGRQYFLRIQESNPDDRFSFKVKNCFSFSTTTQEKVNLTDSRGCPYDRTTMSRFGYIQDKHQSEAIVFSMFKFPDSTLVNINCLVAGCRGSCVEESCDGPAQPSGRSVEDNSPFQFWTSESAYVVEPSEPNAVPLMDCSIHRYSWLLGLCIAFGILFLIMLIVNILLCSALTCSCAKQEVIERDPSVIEDYDPYKTGNGWGSGSQYGSRYSLNGKHDYPSGGSTLNSTTRSISTNSDHYAIVHNHPGSSHHGYHGDDRSSKGGFAHHRGPESTISAGNHSGRM